MNRKSLLALSVIGLGAAATFASAQDSSSNLGIGASIGLYFPNSSVVRGAFGSQLLNYGIGATGASRPSNGSLTPDLGFLNGDSGGNKLFVAAFTEGYEYNLAKLTSPLVPYVRPFVGLSYFDFGINVPGGRDSLKRLGYTYGAEIGAVLNRRIRVAARYNVYSSEQGISFNGVTLQLTYGFM